MTIPPILEPPIPIIDRVKYKSIRRIITANEIEPGKKGYQVLLCVSDYNFPFVMVEKIVQESLNTYLIELHNNSIIRIINPQIVEFF